MKVKPKQLYENKEGQVENSSRREFLKASANVALAAGTPVKTVRAVGNIISIMLLRAQVTTDPVSFSLST